MRLSSSDPSLAGDELSAALNAESLGFELRAQTSSYDGARLYILSTPRGHEISRSRSVRVLIGVVDALAVAARIFDVKYELTASGESVR